MPFTFSHPVVVFPLLHKKTKLSATGLIIGSIAPDFESFIKITGPKIYSHTWPGIFWFDLPLTILLCFLFHLVLRDPLIDNLPAGLKERAEYFARPNWPAHFWSGFGKIILSMIIGITSHLLFDAFTHLNLAEPDAITSTILIGNTRLYIILQYATSIICLALMTRAIYKIPKVNKRPGTGVFFQFWLFVTLLFGLVATWLYSTIFRDVDFDPIVLINIVITSFLSALTIASAGYTIWRKNKPIV